MCTSNQTRLRSSRPILRQNLRKSCHDPRTCAPATKHDCAAVVQYLGRTTGNSGNCVTIHAHVHQQTSTTAQQSSHTSSEPREENCTHKCTNNSARLLNSRPISREDCYAQKHQQLSTTAQQSSNTSAKPREIVTHKSTNNSARLRSSRPIPRLNLGKKCHAHQTDSDRFGNQRSNSRPITQQELRRIV